MNLCLATLYDFLPAPIVKIVLFLSYLLPYWKIIIGGIILIILIVHIRKKKKKERKNNA